jgi:hypothetical protein
MEFYILFPQINNNQSLLDVWTNWRNSGLEPGGLFAGRALQHGDRGLWKCHIFLHHSFMFHSNSQSSLVVLYLDNH